MYILYILIPSIIYPLAVDYVPIDSIKVVYLSKNVMKKGEMKIRAKEHHNVC